MHLEAMIVRTWSPQSSKGGYALGGHDRANMEAVMELVWSYTGRR